MLVYETAFYSVSAMILFATLMAITRRNPVHAVVYLVISFLGTACLFYLLGAPLLAALEVIIYAGAIMVLFLFIIMTMRTQPAGRADDGAGADSRDMKAAAASGAEPENAGSRTRTFALRWALSVLLAVICLGAAGLLIFSASDANTQLMPAMASPAEFGLFLFQNYWLPVEIVSLLLFVALVGALYLGKKDGKAPSRQHGGNP